MPNLIPAVRNLLEDCYAAVGAHPPAFSDRVIAEALESVQREHQLLEVAGTCKVGQTAKSTDCTPATADPKTQKKAKHSQPNMAALATAAAELIARAKKNRDILAAQIARFGPSQTTVASKPLGPQATQAQQLLRKATHGLTEYKQRAATTAIDEVLGNMTEMGADRFNSGVSWVGIYNNSNEAMDAFRNSFIGLLTRMFAPWHIDFEGLYNGLSKSLYLSAESFPDDLIGQPGHDLGGGISALAKQKDIDAKRVAHLFAHEFAHGIDGPSRTYSASSAWKTAWKEEIGKAGWFSQPEPTLTKYAQTHPAEGFAEFARALYVSGMPIAAIRKKFPKCLAVFELNGLWKQPPEVREADESGVAVAMPELFTTRIVLKSGFAVDADGMPRKPELREDDFSGATLAELVGEEDVAEECDCEDEPKQPPVSLDVPDERQSENYSCGAAATVSVARYFGIEPDTESEAIAELRTSPAAGTPPEDIVRVLEAHGLTCEHHDWFDLDGVKKHLREGHPVICPVQMYGTQDEYDADASGHWVVLIGHDGAGELHLQDPVSGRITMEEDEFKRRWHDREEDGTPYERYGIAVWRDGAEGEEAKVVKPDVNALEAERKGTCKKGQTAAKTDCVPATSGPAAKSEPKRWSGPLENIPDTSKAYFLGGKVIISDTPPQRDETKIASDTDSLIRRMAADAGTGREQQAKLAVEEPQGASPQEQTTNFLRRWWTERVPGDVPFPVLYHHLLRGNPKLSVDQFQVMLKSLHRDGTIRLGGWSGPLENLPVSDLATFAGHTAMYYVRPLAPVSEEKAELQEPTGTPVDRCFQKLKKTKGQASASKICQAATGKSLQTGEGKQRMRR